MIRLNGKPLYPKLWIPNASSLKLLALDGTQSSYNLKTIRPAFFPAILIVNWSQSINSLACWLISPGYRDNLQRRWTEHWLSRWVGCLWVGCLWVDCLWVGCLWVDCLWVGCLWVGRLWGHRSEDFLGDFWCRLSDHPEASECFQRVCLRGKLS
jgi:hypothetical protein